MSRRWGCGCALSRLPGPGGDHQEFDPHDAECDFGVCDHVGHVAVRTRAGTSAYIAPEAVEGVGVTSDAWSLFMTMLWVLDVNDSLKQEPFLEAHS